MTKNAAWKRAAREYMKRNPQATLSEAKRQVKRLHEEQRATREDRDPSDDVTDHDCGKPLT